MNTGTYPHLALPSEVAHSAGHEIVLDFSAALSTCVAEYKRGHYTVMLSENLQERYGNTLLGYFQSTLANKVGEEVNLTCVTDKDGYKTVVQMRQHDVPQFHLDLQPLIAPQTAASNQGPSTVDAGSAGKKKVPRPMNCWLHFREAMHKVYKLSNPELSVQEICKYNVTPFYMSFSANAFLATRCSKIWRSYSKEQKEFWRVLAANGAAEHKRLNPNYKYQPRKAGEKKKRQSRKAKEAAAAAAAASETFTVASVPDTMISAHDPSLALTGPANIDNTFDSTAFLGLQQEGLALHDQLHDTESLRHDRLHAEFDSALGMNMPFDLFGDEAFAFRAGADGSATLPSIYSDRY